MESPRLLARSCREQVWRTLLPLIPVAAVLLVCAELAGEWLPIAPLLVGWTALVVHRFLDWSRCGDLWHNGEYLECRRGKDVVSSVRWQDLDGVHFWYHDRVPPEWHGLSGYIPALPRVTVTLKGEEPAQGVGKSLPRFADLYLHSRSERHAAEQQLLHACQQHDLDLRSPRNRLKRNIDWTSSKSV